jgi:hypothetical protein
MDRGRSLLHDAPAVAQNDRYAAHNAGEAEEGSLWRM